MRVLLDDLDSKPGFSNLALMQASSYHKSRGDSVELYRHALPRRRLRSSVPLDVTRDPDLVYVSCVFGWNGATAEAMRRVWPHADVRIGGTGYDIWRAGPGVLMKDVEWSQMPDPIPMFQPDYDLYGYDYAVGFCNRGCDRACKFCVVHHKEGGIKWGLLRPPESWVPDGFTKAMLLDNDLALYPTAQQETIVRWFTGAGVRWSLSQGYDLRCVAQRPELAGLLADNKPRDVGFGHKMLYVAWDYMGNEGPVRTGIERILAAGFRGKEITCYILCGFVDPETGYSDTHADDLHRFDVLAREYRVQPFAMPYNNRKDDPWLNRFARYVNRGPASYRNHTFEDYLAKHPIRERGAQ